MTYEYQGTVQRWIDGDTVELTLDLGFHLTYTNHFRLQGVDTPERGKVGYTAAKDRVNAWAPAGTEVLAVTSKSDKYGRFLVYLRSEVGPSINAILLEENLARPYYGGVKHAD